MLKGYTKNDGEFARRWFLKQKAVEFLGGKCNKCGNENMVCLEFHHLDSAEKDDSISKMLISASWGKIEEELNKCILLCSNCHHETHYRTDGLGKNNGWISKHELLQSISKASCESCGYCKSKACLTFHHEDAKTKKFSIARAMTSKNGLTVDEIYNEIGKCELLCRNCHRIKHFDVERYARLKTYIEHKKETYKMRKEIDYEKIKSMVGKRMRHCDIARELGCCQTTVRCAINRMKNRGDL